MKDPDCSTDECSVESLLSQRNHNYRFKGSAAVLDLLSRVSLLLLFWHIRHSRMALPPEHIQNILLEYTLKT